LKFEIYDLISESDEERNVENDSTGNHIDPDSSADGAGNSIM
jgi:hypothetical protein